MFSHAANEVSKNLGETRFNISSGVYGSLSAMSQSKKYEPGSGKNDQHCMGTTIK